MGVTGGLGKPKTHIPSGLGQPKLFSSVTSCKSGR